MYIGLKGLSKDVLNDARQKYFLVCGCAQIFRANLHLPIQFGRVKSC